MIRLPRKPITAQMDGWHRFRCKARNGPVRTNLALNEGTTSAPPEDTKEEIMDEVVKAPVAPSLTQANAPATAFPRPVPPAQPSPVAPKAVVAPAPRIAPPYAGKTVTSVKTSQVASIFVVDILFSDNTHYFIKNHQGVIEVGGTADMSTGTRLN